jgi:hypothetical protein
MLRRLRRPNITVAPSERVDRYPKLYDHFVEHALQLEAALMTDESTLWDFHGEISCTELQDRIKLIYGVDVSDTVRICEILERIYDQTNRK